MLQKKPPSQYSDGLNNTKYNILSPKKRGNKKKHNMHATYIYK